MRPRGAGACPQGGRAMEKLDLGKLKESFNAAAESVRIVAVLSPT